MLVAYNTFMLTQNSIYGGSKVDLQWQKQSKY
jgi:hypothetical protein